MVANTLIGVRRLMRDPVAYGLQGVFYDGYSPVAAVTDVSFSRLICAGWVCSAGGVDTISTSVSQSIVLTSSMSFKV